MFQTEEIQERGPADVPNVLKQGELLRMIVSLSIIEAVLAIYAIDWNSFSINFQKMLCPYHNLSSTCYVTDWPPNYGLCNQSNEAFLTITT